VGKKERKWSPFNHFFDLAIAPFQSMTHGDVVHGNRINGCVVWKVVMFCMELKFMHSCKKRTMRRSAFVYTEGNVTAKNKFVQWRQKKEERNCFRRKGVIEVTNENEEFIFWSN
jgi:G3E family GTPase